jgi:squalene-hopene/tetraprenyl-beta-curcumene cyclase
MHWKWEGDATGDHPPASQAILERAAIAIDRGFRFLQKAQRSDGSWLPLWFGNQHAPDDENPTYGTARVLAAYCDTGRMNRQAAQLGLGWLRAAQNADGGWGAGSSTPSTVEETALAAEILLSLEEDPSQASESAIRALDWLVNRVERGEWTEPSPIGFYFAKLWYYERLYPVIFTVGALRRAANLFGDNAAM